MSGFFMVHCVDISDRRCRLVQADVFCR